MLPKKLLRFHCIWRHAALINDLIGIWDVIDQSLSHAQLSFDGCLFSLKICSVSRRQCEQTLLLCDSASAVVPVLSLEKRTELINQSINQLYLYSSFHTTSNTKCSAEIKQQR